MSETITNTPICKTQICKRPLTYMEKQKCWRCLVCNPLPKDAPQPKKEKKFLDVAMTDERVKEILAERVTVSEEHIREIVRDELENWYIQKPPVTANEVINEVLPPVELPEGAMRTDEDMAKIEAEREIVSQDWRAQAKALGIPLYHKKKEDVLAEIEAKSNVA